MKVRITSSFHVFVPANGRDRRVAFTAGSVIDAGDLPEGHTMLQWIEKGLAESANGVFVEEAADGHAE